MSNDKLKEAVNVFVNYVLLNETDKVDRALIDSKLLYIYLEMPKAKRNDMKKLAPVLFEVETDDLKAALYQHYGIEQDL